ncbi:oxidoreductase [Paraburkholderia solisilvae]|uniref:3-phenylpropionate-dihydrodiol/cinnamic acid-dihydrodiol dehydrogenase n=1 Tax=Paraburkholderia solisilvae TaxID=624376 RepID=A0A6J5DC84_9BURK|nr:oxidoreductase [Paraburkholderia solisilvae]CAB3751573.1 3-phenylpropionate-dihydrodiol/cinnamic acid-dihydrodiol dehydrogenase [Paraburkholderia solisilvae]
MTSTTTPVWFITGCSTGFGRQLAHAVLARGWRCVATARNKASLAGLAGEVDKAGEVGDVAGRLLTIDLDVTDARQIGSTVEAALKRFGAIDVLVNNAGYGYQAAIEEGVEAEIRAQFDVNVFGLFAMTRAVLPTMRARRKGHVLNITSLAGLAGYAGSGYYAASKHAVEGWSDSLAVEVEPLGIKVTCIEPGPFRTDWAGRSLKQTPNRIADYAETAGKRMQVTAQSSGTQHGDPVRAAQAMLSITEVSDPPRNLALGAGALDGGTKRLHALLADFDKWRDTSLGADFPEGGK